MIGMDRKEKIEFIESYIKVQGGDYQWNDNHGELIRCKNCKHHGEGTCSAAAGIAYPPPDEWYCADGERKDNDNG